MKKTAKLVAAIAAMMMVLAFASCNEKGGTANIEKLKKVAPAPEADFEIQLREDGKSVDIIQYKGNAKTLVIPATIQGMPVMSAVGRTFAGTSEKLTSVVVSEGIEAIANDAFYGAKNLTTVVLPSTLKAIGRSAFEGCEKLQNITLPEGLVAIDRGAFANSGLTSITLPQSLQFLEQNAFVNCDNLSEINIPAEHNLSYATVQEIKYSGAEPKVVTESNQTLESTGAFFGTKIQESVALQKLLRDTVLKETPKEVLDVLSRYLYKGSFVYNIDFVGYCIDNY